MPHVEKVLAVAPSCFWAFLEVESSTGAASLEESLSLEPPVVAVELLLVALVAGSGATSLCGAVPADPVTAVNTDRQEQDKFSSKRQILYDPVIRIYSTHPQFWPIDTYSTYVHDNSICVHFITKS